MTVKPYLLSVIESHNWAFHHFSPIRYFNVWTFWHFCSKYRHSASTMWLWFVCDIRPKK